jgi:hypothetical protein
MTWSVSKNPPYTLPAETRNKHARHTAPRPVSRTRPEANDLQLHHPQPPRSGERSCFTRTARPRDCAPNSKGRGRKQPSALTNAFGASEMKTETVVLDGGMGDELRKKFPDMPWVSREHRSHWQ